MSDVFQMPFHLKIAALGAPKSFMGATRTLYFCNKADKLFENHRRTYKADSSVSLHVLINYEVSDLISAV